MFAPKTSWFFSASHCWMLNLIKKNFHYSIVKPINLSLNCYGLKMLDFEKLLIIKYTRF